MPSKSKQAKTVKQTPRTQNTKRQKFADPLHTYVASLIDLAKQRAKRKRVPFNLTYAHIPQLAASRLCPVTGLPYVLGVAKDGNRPHPLAPSIDRREAHKGYVADNVRLTSWWANSARNSMSDEQFGVMVEAAFRTRQSATLA